MAPALVRTGWPLLALAALPAAAQTPRPAVRDTLAAPAAQPAPATRPPCAEGWMPVRGEAEERLRIAQLRGEASTDGFLLRSPSSQACRAPGAVRVQLLAPWARAVVNSDLPSVSHEGGAWAGRGATYELVGGVRVDAGPVQLIVAPRVAYVQNREFDFPVVGAVDSSAFRPRWRSGRFSADLPIRFGVRPFRELDLGQSSLVVRGGGLAVGAATESQWWGPGIRTSIVLSDNAPGFPHLFLRTDEPWRTRVGSFTARWSVGALTESPYFDRDEENDLRSHSAFGVTFTPAGEPGLSLGLSRAVYAPVDGAGDLAGRAGDVFLRWRSSDDAEEDDPAPQVFAAFARWVFPAAGAEVYGEWAWHQLPGTARELFAAPNRARGYTLGGQWLRPLGTGRGALRLQGEAAQLEASPTYRVREDPSFYASASVPQGYTHRGRSLGAFSGPGSSTQWAAADWLGARARGGIFAGRVRWDNDAYFLEHSSGSYHAHDVSLLLGARGALGTRVGSVGVEVQREKRLNYLFINPTLMHGGENALDVASYSLRLTLSPTR